MGKLWARFRDLGSQKAERGHFGLAWSVFAGYFLAGSVFLRSVHEKGWLMTAFNVLAIVFFVLGGVGVYMAFAVAMRWPPHHPKKRDIENFTKMEDLFIKGISRLQALEDANGPTAVLAATGLGSALKVTIDQAVNEMHDWGTEAEAFIKEKFGEDEALRFKISSDLSRTPPHWAESAGQTGTWHNARGRIDWIRAWMQEQANL